MKNFYTRTITGAVFVVVLIGSILIHPLMAFGLFGLIILLGMLEYFRLLEVAGYTCNRISGIVTALVVFASFLMYACGWVNSLIFLAGIPLSAYIFISELYRKKDTPFVNIALTMLGIIYIAVPFALLLLSGFSEYGLKHYDARLILGFFILLWSSDTGAYLFGMAFGKHPFFPRISPKKSWEGFIGGILFTLAVSWVVSRYIESVTTTDWMIMALIICVFGAWGDLTESMLKRSLNVKDSGTILPGHGGILDRFDSVLFAAPIVFLYLHTKFLLF